MTRKQRSEDNLNLKSKLRVVPGFPKHGVNFIDITTLLKDPLAFKVAIDSLTSFFGRKKIDVLVGIEARGFMIGAPIAYNLGIGFVPARKRGKLPADKLTEEYSLEYSTELLELHKDGIEPGQKVGVVDDLLATGGTANAAARLVEKMGGQVICIGFLVELDFLRGRDKINRYEVLSLVHFEE